MGPLDINVDELNSIQNDAAGHPKKPPNIKWSVWKKMSEDDKNDAWE